MEKVERICDVFIFKFIALFRSELMELEKTSNQLQEECNTLNEVLEKSKQKKVC